MSETYIPKRAMLIYAHPDDIEFSAGGTAAKWAIHGSEVYYIVITDGNIGSHEEGMTAEKLIETRRSEQRAAAKTAGAKECIFLGYQDGLLQPSLELRKELVRLIRRYRPNAIICGDPTNYFPSENRVNHPDHRAAGTAALDAAFPAAEMPLLYPELEAEGLSPHKVNYIYVSNPKDPANYFVDITETMDLKIKALRQHVSQLGEWDPEEPIKKWNKETGKIVGFKFAERFLRITLKEPEIESEAGSANE
ncbi:MAG: PIG-L family deacetylase [Anaerolineae bacterium]|nr:MAG: PIG-L family deacetylase [Anaerolineae bacterium]